MLTSPFYFGPHVRSAGAETNPRRSIARAVAATMVATSLVFSAAACSSGDEGGEKSAVSDNGSAKKGDKGGEDKKLRLEHAQLKPVSIDSSRVVGDSSRSGAETATEFFDQAEEVVVAGNDPQALASAAAVAVQRGVPMLTQLGQPSTVASELKRLGVKKVYAFGPVSSQGELRAAGAEVKVETAPEDSAEAAQTLAGVGKDRNAAVAKLPVDAAGEAPERPAVLVTEETSIAAVATARAAGANVKVLPAADPRATGESMKLTKNGALAIGEAFGGQERFDAAAKLSAAGELPGGGGLLFPGRRMIALYGHPSGGALGVMGEQPPQEAAQRVQKLVEEYQPHTDYQVMPAFEIIATVASSSPGGDGDFSNEADPKELEPYVDAITDAGGYAFLDLQPGRASLLDQAKRYEDLLKKPNVGLALDPEWKLGPNDMPMDNVGHVQVEEINEVAEWLAKLTRENNIPQKGLIVHQFQQQMIRNRENLDTSHPELAIIIHADGHGVAEEKFATWEATKKDLPRGVFLAWKNFYDEDSPTFSPEKTYSDVKPRPWFVSYQ